MKRFERQCRVRRPFAPDFEIGHGHVALGCRQRGHRESVKHRCARLDAAMRWCARRQQQQPVERERAPAPRKRLRGGRDESDRTCRRGCRSGRSFLSVSACSRTPSNHLRLGVGRSRIGVEHMLGPIGSAADTARRLPAARPIRPRPRPRYAETEDRVLSRALRGASMVSASPDRVHLRRRDNLRLRGEIGAEQRRARAGSSRNPRSGRAPTRLRRPPGAPAPSCDRDASEIDRRVRCPRARLR